MTGNLGIFSLADLLQLLSSSTQTGNLTIDHPEGEAHVYFDSGNIVHAELNDKIGEQAIKTLFTQEQGDFEFFATGNTFETSVERTINKNTDMLLIQALGSAEDARLAQGAQTMSSLAIPYFVKTNKLNQTQADSDLSLEPKEVTILQLVNGQRTVQTMAIETGIDINDVKSFINRMVEAEVLSISKPEIRVARLVVRMSDTSLPHNTVAVDKKILRNWSKHLNYPVSYIKCKHPDGPILSFKAEPRDKLGPFMEVSRGVLIQHALLVDMALLVKPKRELS